MADKPQFSMPGEGLLVRAPAKINLSLLITGKRDDGFHEIETVMAKVDLYDELLFEHGGKEGIELICRGKYEAPSGRDNLVWRACEMLVEAADARPKIKVTLTKNLPVGSGLGGGSSDAAAALIGLNRFANLGVGRRRLGEMAAGLGSDVRFFLGGPLAFCSGRGEKIKKIKKKFPFCAILVLPDITVSTKKVYENYKHDHVLYNTLSDRIKGHTGKKDIDLAARVCANMLQSSSFELYNDLADLKSRVEALGIGRLCLSGSGSAMFSMVTGAKQDDVKRYQSVLDGIGCESVVIHNNRW